MLDFYQGLFAYDNWANQQTLRSVQQFPVPPARGVQILAHILGVEWLWMARLKGEPNTIVWPDWGLEHCRVEAENLPDAWEQFLHSLDERSIRKPVPYVNSKGERFTNTPEQILMHVVMHGAYHRGQIAREVRDAGGTPAYTDFIEGVRRGMPR